MDIIFGLIDKKDTLFNDVWFAIFAELLQLSGVLLNVANYQQALTTVAEIMPMYGNARNLRNLRLCLTSILSKEQELLQSKSINEDFLVDLWNQMVNHLISETTTNSEEIKEKQLVLQMLIRHKKLNQKMASTLLHNITTNEMLKRNECFATIREIFIHADKCGQDKASADLEPIIAWAYGSGDRNNTAQLIHNIASIDSRLQADTFAISIINFLDEQQLEEISRPSSLAVPVEQNLLAYKYNKQLICLDKDYAEYSRKEILPQKITPFHLPSCLGILSYLFELNVEKDEALRTRIMKCITKTVTLAKDRVQLHVDLVEYLPELSNFARSANAARKLEIVRLYLIFASEVGHGIEL